MATQHRKHAIGFFFLFHKSIGFFPVFCRFLVGSRLSLGVPGWTSHQKINQLGRALESPIYSEQRWLFYILYIYIYTYIYLYIYICVFVLYIDMYLYVYLALFGPTHFKQNKSRNQELYLKHSKTGMTILAVDLRQTSPHITISPSFGTHPNQRQAWSV
jgi:hypothetical protein